MRKPKHRRAAERRGLRYPSDMTEAERALVAPMIPPAKRGGQATRCEHPRGSRLNAIFHVLSTGCQWQALPKGPPLTSTAHHYFVLRVGTPGCAQIKNFATAANGFTGNCHAC